MAADSFEVPGADGTFQLNEDTIVKVASVLAHRARLAILHELRRAGESSPVLITRSKATDLSMNSISYHFEALRTAGVIEVIRTEQQRGALQFIQVLTKDEITLAALAVLDLLEGVSANRFASYDRGADTVAIPLGHSDAVVTEKKEWGLLELDANSDRVVGVQITNASKRLPTDLLAALLDPPGDSPTDGDRSGELP